MRRRLRFAFIAAVGGAALFVAAACEPALPDYPPESGCSIDAGSGCGSHAGGGTGAGSGSGGSSATSGSGGSIGSNEILGTLGLVTSECFDSSTPFMGQATISVVGISGSAMYGGGNPASFDFTGVPGSGVWMYVTDPTGGGGFLPTVSFVALPQAGAITLPVVDQGMLSNLAAMQTNISVTGGLNPALAHIVLTLTHGGSAYQGVAVTGGSGSGDVAYDLGGCFYSDGAMSTGASGRVIIFNAGLSGPSTITLQDKTTMQSFMVSVQAQAGAVTLFNAAF